MKTWLVSFTVYTDTRYTQEQIETAVAAALDDGVRLPAALDAVMITAEDRS